MEKKNNSAEAKQVSLQLQLTFLLRLQAAVSDAVTEYNRHLWDSLAEAPQLLEGPTATEQLQEMLQIHLVARRNENEQAESKQRRNLCGIEDSHFSPCPVATGASYGYHKDSANSPKLLFVSARISVIQITNINKPDLCKYYENLFSKSYL